MCTGMYRDAGLAADHGTVRRLLPDPENLDILVWVGDRLLPREMAKVSIFDSTVQVRRRKMERG